MTCTSPIPWATLVDYWAHDLTPADADAVEEHVFACDACAAGYTRIGAIVGATRAMLMPAIDAAQLAALRGAGLVVVENAFRPAERREVVFPSGADLLIHRLGGLELAGAERVSLAVSVESTGELLFEDPYAPFDPARGEVLIACQRHFVAYPRDVRLDVTVHHHGGAAPATATFLIPHVYQ